MESLAPELLSEVCSYLTYSDQLQFRLVSRYTNQVLLDNDIPVQTEYSVVSFRKISASIPQPCLHPGLRQITPKIFSFKPKECSWHNRQAGDLAIIPIISSLKITLGSYNGELTAEENEGIRLGAILELLLRHIPQSYLSHLGPTELSVENDQPEIIIRRRISYDWQDWPDDQEKHRLTRMSPGEFRAHLGLGVVSDPLDADIKWLTMKEILRETGDRDKIRDLIHLKTGLDLDGPAIYWLKRFTRRTYMERLI